MSYQIQILSDEEFEELPYSEAGISLGLADTKTNTAYVRYVANGELQKYLVNHELEHLIGSDRDEIHHDGEGVYYKGFGNVFSGIGSALSGAGSSIMGGLSNIGSGISNLAGSATRAMGFGGGFQGGANPSGGMAAAAASNPALRAPTGYSGGLASMGANFPQFRIPSSGLSSFGQLGASPMGFGGSTQGYTPRSTQGMGMQGPSLGGMQSSSPRVGSSSQAGSQGQPPSPGTQQQAQGGGFMDAFGGELMSGLGSMASNKIMSMFGGSGGMATGGGNMPHIPDLSQLPSVQQYKSFDFRNNLDKMDPALQDAVNRDFDRIDAQEQHDFRNRWKNIRPGADIENDSVFAKDYQSLQQTQATRRADALAKYRMENMQFQFGVNKTEAQRLMDLAQLDISTISFNTGLDAQEAMQLKMIAGYKDLAATGSDVASSEPTGFLNQFGSSLGTGVANKVGSMVSQLPSFGR